MKPWAVLLILFSWLQSSAQTDSDYTSLLNSTQEVNIADSVCLNADPIKPIKLDSTTVKKWFASVLPGVTTNRLKNRSYYLAGKITSNTDFDLLVLMEEKRKSDSSNVQVVYLVSTRKDGKYIASLEVAVAGVRKKSNYNTSSWLYNDYKIVLNSKFVLNEKPYDDITYYKINKGGRFILSPNY